jgi:hypothetical protein
VGLEEEGKALALTMEEYPKMNCPAKEKPYTSSIKPRRNARSSIRASNRVNQIVLQTITFPFQ